MIDYAMGLLDIHWGYYLAAIVIGIVVRRITKKWSVSFSWTYIFIVAAITVLSRDSYIGNHYQPHLFWSWNVPKVRNQLLLNILGFIPLGIFLSPAIGWKSVPTVTCFSLFIEVLQLFLQKGLFEYDDVIHNTLGALIGYGLFELYVWIRITYMKDNFVNH